MPRLKTHKGTQKRFHFTGSGKIMRTKGGKSHLRRKKSAATKRLYAKTILVSGSERHRIKRLVPYGV